MTETRIRPERYQSKKNQKFSDEELLEQYDKGLTNRQIAMVLGVTQAAIFYRMGALGKANNYHNQEIPRMKLICPHCGKDIEDVKTEVVT